MVFLLMGIMSLLFILSTGVTVFLAVYRQGKLLENKWVFILLSTSILVELYIGITSLPTNFIIKKIIYAILIALSASNLFIYKKNFNTSRLILSIISIITVIALFKF